MPERPKSTLRSGLEKHERERLGLKAPKFAYLIGKRTRLSDLQSHRNDIAKTVAKLHELREKTQLARTKREAEIREHWAKQFWTEGDPSRHGIMKIEEAGAENKRQVGMDRDRVRMRRDLAAAAEKDVGKQLASLRESKAALAEARTDWDHCVNVLSRETLTSRTEYADSLMNAGVNELDSRSRQAIQEGNKALAGAVISRMDRLGKDQRSQLIIRKDDLAEALVFVSFREAVSLIAIGELNIELGELEGREALAQDLNDGDTRRVGLKKIAVEQEVGRELVEDDFAHQAITGTPAKKPAEKKKPAGNYGDDTEQWGKDFNRFNALVQLDQRTDVEMEEYNRLGLKLDVFED